MKKDGIQTRKRKPKGSGSSGSSKSKSSSVSVSSGSHLTQAVQPPADGAGRLSTPDCCTFHNLSHKRRPQPMVQ